MAAWTEQEKRSQRRYEAARRDQRNEFQRDRDRVLYSSAFRRLGGVTQVARAGDADVFHNRLTHTVKVGQIGRRIAQRLREEHEESCEFHGVNEEVVEAACLAHDLGHPPFGHMGEHVLDELVRNKSNSHPWDADPEGFEGNAQSFRVISKLAVRFEENPGLDLTRASLAACIKYPWARDYEDDKKANKFGFYKDEENDFSFARCEYTGSEKTAEAELMDWADDIAYSVHDLEDFHRCGVIPWMRIFSADDDRVAADTEYLITEATKNWFGKPIDAEGRLREAHRRLRTLFLGVGTRLMTEPYEGTAEQRKSIRMLTSKLIGRYIAAIQLKPEHEFRENGKTVHINENLQHEVLILKQITRSYIIRRTALGAQQRGQEKIICDLFRDFYDDIRTEKLAFIPKRFYHICTDDRVGIARRISDCISSLSELEAYRLHARLSGRDSGSVIDPIVW